MVTSILLVHSPLLGPSTWARCAESMRSHGLDVRVPDLTAAAKAPPPRWEAFVGAAAEAAATLPGEVAVVGHSGAGVFLPAMAGRLGRRAVALLFVDAVVPPPRGAHETPARLRRMLDEQTVDGRLRRWLDWWSKDVVDELVPDVSERAAMLADMPSLPRSFYDESVPVPEAWMEQRCAYLQLSDAYDAESVKASDRGWQHARLDADHLAIRTQPRRVAQAIETLLDTHPGAARDATRQP